MTRPARILLITSGAVFLTFLDTSVVNIAFPSIKATFDGSSTTTLSWILSGYNIVFAALLVPAGMAGDLVGRRALFLCGVAGFLAASTVCALASTPAMLIVARAVQGVGAAAMVPTGLGLALAEYPAEQRGRLLGLWGGNAALAAAIGPTVGGLLTGTGGWRWVFLVNIPISLLVLTAGARVLPKRRDRSRAIRPDLLGSLLLAGGVALLALAITKAPPTEWGLGDARVVGALAAAAALLVAFVARSAGRPNAVIDLNLFRRRSFAAGNAGTLVISLGFYAMLLANATFLQEVWGYGPVEAGIALSVSPLSAALFAVLGGRLADRYGPRAVVVPGALLFATGCAIYALATGARPDYLVAWVPAALLGGSGVGLTIPVLIAASLRGLPPERYSTGSGMAQTCRQLGAALGVAALVAILSVDAGVTGFHTAWWLIAATGAVAAMLGMLLGPRPHKAAASSSALVTGALQTNRSQT